MHLLGQASIIASRPKRLKMLALGGGASAGGEVGLPELSSIPASWLQGASSTCVSIASGPQPR
jgi:hypothetical protein